MRKSVEILLLPGPGRPVRRWVLTRARAFAVAVGWVVLSLSFAAMGFATAHLFLLRGALW